MSKRGGLIGLIVGALVASAGTAEAKTFRYATLADLRTMDPMGLFETFTLATQGAVYEGLVRTNRKLEFQPSLATERSQPSPTVLRFKIRPNAKFHDGSTLSSADAVFSFGRDRADGSDVN